MDESRSQKEGKNAAFREILRHRGLWSCCGYDGLSIVFDLTLEDVRSLGEDQKRALMRLVSHIADFGDETVLDQLHALEGLSAQQRLGRLLDLSGRIPAEPASQ